MDTGQVRACLRTPIHGQGDIPRAEEDADGRTDSRDAWLVAIPRAADDPIAIRQALMDSNGIAPPWLAGVMKGDIAYSPVIGKAVINSLAATSDAFGSFFPEGSTDPARSSASPKILGGCPGCGPSSASSGRHRRRPLRRRGATARPMPRPSPAAVRTDPRQLQRAVIRTIGSRNSAADARIRSDWPAAGGGGRARLLSF